MASRYVRNQKKICIRRKTKIYQTPQSKGKQAPRVGGWCSWWLPTRSHWGRSRWRQKTSLWGHTLHQQSPMYNISWELGWWHWGNVSNRKYMTWAVTWNGIPKVAHKALKILYSLFIHFLPHSIYIYEDIHLELIVKNTSQVKTKVVLSILQ